MQELLAAHPPELIPGQFATLLAQVIPEVEVTDEVRIRISESGVLLPRCLFPVNRAFPRIGNRQRGGNDQYFANAALAFGLNDHATDPRIDRQASQPATQRRN